MQTAQRCGAALCKPRQCWTKEDCSNNPASGLEWAPSGAKCGLRDGVTNVLNQDVQTDSETLGFKMTKAALTYDFDAHQSSLSLDPGCTTLVSYLPHNVSF